MSNRKRKKLFVDYQVQGAILARIAMYWLFCFVFISVSMLLFQTLSHPDQPFWVHIGPMCERFWPVYLAMFGIAPFVLYDALRVSNRFCGPLSRVVQELDQFNKNGEFNNLEFRDGDFWQPLSSSISEVVERAKRVEA